MAASAGPPPSRMVESPTRRARTSAVLRIVCRVLWVIVGAYTAQAAHGQAVALDRYLEQHHHRPNPLHPTPGPGTQERECRLHAEGGGEEFGIANEPIEPCRLPVDDDTARFAFAPHAGRA